MDRRCMCMRRRHRRGDWRTTPYPAIRIVESSPIGSESGYTTAIVRIDEPLCTPCSNSVFQTIQSESEGPYVRRLIENSQIEERIELQKKRKERVARAVSELQPVFDAAFQSAEDSNSSDGTVEIDLLLAAAEWIENNPAIDTEPRSQRPPEPNPLDAVRRVLSF